MPKGPIWRVFISHTSELRAFPHDNSYVAAVERAISAAGHAIVDMADFPAAELLPADLCAGQVRDCDVYVGVLGTRYGSPVRDKPEVSYTELEFDTATQVGLPRLVFVLNTDVEIVGIPPAFLIDREFGARQDAFRRRVQESGVTTQWFASPVQLGQLVERSLRELAQHQADVPQPVAGRLVFGAIPQLAQWFQPRPAEQDALAAVLADSRRAALVALPGARGVGKSQLAAALARDCEAEGFDLVAWINAENGPVTDLAQLAIELGVAGADQTPEQSAKAAIRAVSADDGRRRLVVFDNVDDPDRLTPYLPASGTVKVVVTTNRQEFTTMNGVTAVEIGMFTPNQGLAYLSGATGLSEADGAHQLAERLGWLPLGLSQAAAHIRLNHLGFRQYLSKLDTLPLDETLRRQAGSLHPGILAATRLSLDSIGRADPSGNTTDLLTVLAVLAPEGISRHMLTRPKALTALHIDNAAVSHALELLANTSMITLAGSTKAEISGDQDGVVIVVHRLTAAIVRRVAPVETLTKTIETSADLLQALADQLPGHQAALRRAELDELVAHILALRTHAHGSTSKLRELAGWVADNLSTVGDFTRAIRIHEDLVTESEQALGPDHRETLARRHNLATDYRSAGDYDAAIALHEQTVADYERILRPDHPNTLNSRNNLAIAYRSVGRNDEAIALHERNVADYERVRGPDHPHTLISRHSLASAYRAAGRNDEAIALHERNVADYERVLGPDHPDTLNSRHGLATAYRAAGRNDEAIALHERNVADRERILGPDHPHTLTGRHNLATAYRAAGRNEEAIALHKQTLADRERILGSDHPYTLASRHNLAYAYRAAGRNDEAIALHEQNLAEYERVLGPDHPDTLNSRNNLAAAYRSAGRKVDGSR